MKQRRFTERALDGSLRLRFRDRVVVITGGASGIGRAPGERFAAEGARVASTGRLISILVALVLFSEVVPLQYTMVGVIIPKIGAAFPQSGSSTSWACRTTARSR